MGITFTQLPNEHLDDLARRHYSAATLHVRRIRLKIFFDWCTVRGITDPSPVTRSLVEEYQAHLFHYRKHNDEPCPHRLNILG